MSEFFLVELLSHLLLKSPHDIVLMWSNKHIRRLNCDCSWSICFLPDTKWSKWNPVVPLVCSSFLHQCSQPPIRKLCSLCVDGTFQLYYSAQVPWLVLIMSWTNGNTCMCTDTHIHCMHTMNCTPAVKHNTLIFRTAPAERLLHGKWCGGEERSDKKRDVLWGWIMLMGLGNRSPRSLQSPGGNQRFDCQASNLKASPQSLCVCVKLHNGETHNERLIKH